MTKKAKISFLIVVWSIVAIQMYVNYKQHVQMKEDAISAFSVVEDSRIEGNIRGYGKFGEMELSAASRKKMLENLANKLGITDGYTYSTGRGDGFQKMVLTKEGKHAKTVIQIISMEQKDGEPEQYIVTEITTKQKAEAVVSLYRKLQRVYEEIGVEAEVSVEISGSEDGNQMSVEKGSLPDQIFTLVRAKKVDEITENGICTVYGYTRLEDQYLTLHGKKVNIQMVMSYDEKQDKTYVKIGVPIVNSSY